MKPQYNSLRAKVTAPARVFTIPVKNSKLPGLPQMDTEAEERWWAEVWRTRGLPDPAACTLAEFKAALQARPSAPEAGAVTGEK